VNDVTDAFVRAREHGPWQVEQLVGDVPADAALGGMRVEWDQAAGEDWLRVLKTSLVLALVWVPGPLVIATSGHHEIVDEIERLTGVTVEQIAVPHIDSPVLSLRPDRLAELWPDRDWPVGAVDPSALSAHDLWYATC